MNIAPPQIAYMKMLFDTIGSAMLGNEVNDSPVKYGMSGVGESKSGKYAIDVSVVVRSLTSTPPYWVEDRE